MDREELERIAAAAPEGRRRAWMAAGSERSIYPEGNDWVAREGGREVARHPTDLGGLMNKLGAP